MMSGKDWKRLIQGNADDEPKDINFMLLDRDSIGYKLFKAFHECVIFVVKDPEFLYTVTLSDKGRIRILTGRYNNDIVLDENEVALYTFDKRTIPALDIYKTPDDVEKYFISFLKQNDLYEYFTELMSEKDFVGLYADYIYDNHYLLFEAIKWHYDTFCQDEFLDNTDEYANMFLREALDKLYKTLPKTMAMNKIGNSNQD